MEEAVGSTARDVALALRLTLTLGTCFLFSSQNSGETALFLRCELGIGRKPLSVVAAAASPDRDSHYSPHCALSTLVADVHFYGVLRSCHVDGDCHSAFGIYRD